MTEETGKVAVGKRSLWQCGSQFQQVTKGFVECPKCFGACEIDMTLRDRNYWPVGPCSRITCDHCDGEGEVLPSEASTVTQWGAQPNAEPVRPIPSDNPGWGAAPSAPPVDKENPGWG